MQKQDENAIIPNEEEKPLRLKDFQLISTSLHHVDFFTDTLTDASDKLDGNEISEYINQLIDTITSKGDKRSFIFPPSFSAISLTVDSLISDADKHSEYARNIASRLLEKEIIAQAERKKKNLKHDLRKGSLIQALLRRYDKFEYLILKIEHDSYFDLENLIKQYGLAEKKSVIKSCLIKFNDEYKKDSVFLTDTNADISKYWWDSFLELKKVRLDDDNTSIAFKEVDKLLVRFVKKYDVKENRLLKDSMIRYFKERELMNYSNFKEELFNNYKPVNKEIKYDKFLEALTNLGKSNRFDTTFTIIGDAIQKEMTSKYRVTNKISLVIDGDLPKDAIKSEIEPSGSKYLKIKIDDSITFKQFEK